MRHCVSLTAVHSNCLPAEHGWADPTYYLSTSVYLRAGHFWKNTYDPCLGVSLSPL